MYYIARKPEFPRASKSANVTGGSLKKIYMKMYNDMRSTIACALCLRVTDF
ncbi:hypothetical protein WN55_07437 [Dufourea novaeangliae]|uniref:Uncharacterized protein n=1 Tax=Dufourea novaeangliae TaxID=178035 RepID=A0A154PSJ5_DUFNO|nr:hypothetical protein WN55_07437 [Dufourea novaeangliae]